MIRKLVFLSLFISALFISACGVVVTPVGDAEPTEIMALPTEGELISLGGAGGARPTVEPTATSVPPTATVVPPTATVAPTEAPTEEATVEATEEDHHDESAAPVSDDPLAVLISLYDPAEGETLFNRMEPSNGYACSTCHLANSESSLIGPGLLNVGIHGATHVEGQGAETYIYNSIVDPAAYVVAGFPANLMPTNWAQVYTEDQIYALVAYLLTLKG